MFGRRTALAGLASCVAAGRVGAEAALPELRLGILQFGTVQWVADVIRRHELDRKHGFTLRTVKLANTDGARVAVMAGSADVTVVDWLFAAAQRTNGAKLCFAPFSSASGGIVAAHDSPIRSLADLASRRLGVVGGPLDKSWLLVQAAARKTHGLDLATAANVVYGAPPLLGAKLQQGELDAVLTFWNFAAKLEAAGFREVIPVSQCTVALDLPERMSLVGFVFHQDWADANRAAIDGFLAASDEAQQLLLHSDAEWQLVRPLMDADDDALFEQLRRRFVQGVPHPDAAGQEQAALKLFAILFAAGGARATGGIDALPPGLFWPVRDATG